MRTWGNVALLAVCTCGNAQNSAVPDKKLDWVSVQSAPKVDGVIQPAEYPDSSRGTSFEWGFDGSPSPYPAEFWLCSDSQNVYFAFRVKKDPKTIRADQFRPNSSLSGDDWVRLFLDATGVGEGGDTFQMNASTGNQLDLFGGRANKIEWSGQFESKGRKTDSGWEAECRIPWSLISNIQAGKRDFKFAVVFSDPKNDRNYTWQFQNQQPRTRPTWIGVVAPQVKKQRAIDILPYFTTSIDKSSGPGFDSGLDFKASGVKGLTYVGSINPDFRNIENAVLSLGFSYFERLAGEARPFFQEGGEYLPGGDLFTSQRISNFDAALKAYGNLSKRDQFGFLRTEDFGNRGVTAFKFAHNTADQQNFAFSYVGNQQPGLNNDASLFEYTKSWKGRSLSFGMASTKDAVVGGGNGVSINYNSWSPTLYFGVNGGYLSGDYMPRVGFVTLTDVRGMSAYSGYNREEKKGSLLSWGWNLSASRYFTGAGQRLNEDQSLFFYGVTRKQVGFNAGVNKSIFLSRDQQAGTSEEFHDFGSNYGLSYPANDPFRNVYVSRSTGKQGGEYTTSTDFGFKFRPLNRLTGSVAWSEFDRGTTEHQLIGSVSYDIGMYETVSTRFVHQSDDWNVYFSYRLSGKKGNEMFVILGDPNAPTFQNRLALKFVTPVKVRY